MDKPNKTTVKQETPTNDVPEKPRKANSILPDITDSSESEDTDSSEDDEDDEDDDDDDDDDMSVCVHCKRCFISDADLIPHCVSMHYCDSQCFEQCGPAYYERHHRVAAYGSLGLTENELALRVPLKRCPDCDKVFVCHYDFSEHAMQRHLNPKPYECVCCERTFETPWNRTQHLMRIKKEREIECRRCGKGVASVQSVDGHVFNCRGVLKGEEAKEDSVVGRKRKRKEEVVKEEVVEPTTSNDEVEEKRKRRGRK